MGIDYEAFMARLATGTPVTLSQWNGIGVILRRESPAYSATENSYRASLSAPGPPHEPGQPELSAARLSLDEGHH